MRRNMVSRAGRPRAGKLVIGLYFISLVLPAAPVLASSLLNSMGISGLDSDTRFLPVDQAFQLSVSWQGQSVSVGWYIKPGYYLYRHRLAFSSPDATLGKPQLPKGEQEKDPYFGTVVTYRNELLVNLPVLRAGKSLTLEVKYQGCADAGYCYPPQKQTVKVVKSR